MIKAIVFDLGNVVLTSDHAFNMPEELIEFCQYFNVTMDNLSTAFQVSFPQYSLGKISEDEYWNKFLYTARAKKRDIEYAKAFYRKHQKENEHMLTLLNILKNNYRLAALTTIPKEWLEFKKEKFNLTRYFDLIVSSGYYGIAKPDIEIYKTLINKLQLSPHEILFIDDSEIVLPPAEKLGIQTILFRGQADIEGHLKKQKLL